MGLSFENPAWLFLIAAALPAAWLGIRWFSSMSRARRWSAVALRVILISLISAMLAGASFIRRTERLTIIGVVDVSDSVRLFGVAPGKDGPTDAVSAAKRFLLASAPERGPDDLLGIVAFDGHAMAVAMPTRGDLAERSIDVRMVEGTDIASALRYAAALIPPDSSGRIVLITDGDQTSGDAISAAREVAGKLGSGVPVDVVPVRLDASNEVIVESLDVPPRAAAEATITARVSMLASAPSRGTLQLLHEGEPLDINGTQPGSGRRIELQPGRHIELITVPLPIGMVHRFTAVYTPDETQPGRLSGDTRIENNRAEGLTITPGKGSVLLVDGVNTSGGPGGGGILARTLKEAGIDVTVVQPEGIPSGIIALAGYDLIILENVPAELVSTDTQRAIISHIRDMGAGLIMVGGPDSLGAGGWKGTELEPILPVKLDLPEKLVQPDAAVMFVLDNSGSMQRPVLGSIYSQQEIANQSAALAVKTLTKKDMVGVIVFNSDFTVVKSLSPNDDPQATADRIMSIAAGGGTNMIPALEEAGRQMADVKAAVKHIIVLSDGRSMGFERLPGIAERIHLKSGANISTIGVGDEADERTMAEIAGRGGGKSFMVNNPNMLPKFFMKAVRVLRTPLVREGAFDPVLLPSGSPLTTGLDTPPQLFGLILTQRRPEPTITYAMAAPTGEPLLAHWNVELGKAAVFTSDASKWAKAWLDWPGYRQLWVQIVRSLSRARSESPYDISVDVSNGEMHIVLDATSAQGKPVDQLSVPVTVTIPGSDADRASRQVQTTLSQTAPGVYEATIPARDSGVYVALVKPSQNGVRLPSLIAGASVSYGIEFAHLITDRALLEQIARESRGRVLDLSNPGATKLFDRTTIEPREARSPLWRPLLFWTLLVLLLDVATRRIAWDRFVSREFGVDLRRAAAESVQDRGAKAAKIVEKLREAPKKVDAEVERTAAVRLSDEDAALVAEAEAERRRQARLAAIQATREKQKLEHIAEEPPTESAPDAPPPARAAKPVTEPPKPQPDEPGASGLLAAKKRARERLDRGPE